jgi:hypothetical protein
VNLDCSHALSGRFGVSHCSMSQSDMPF